ncbi:flagellar assembly protein FliW [Nocardioides yefusunii]|uniref:Flagellar assembly factor FliW n=1 Tax=Nocardioides yefusunii TaxID=2500546 RepID=A0ABW1R0M4_9ACTN|nr:flagellar assembly protein FliW [Nocardioides yefusunii]
MTDPAVHVHDDLAVIEFVTPVLGFPDHHRFTLVRLDEDGVLCELTCIDDASVRFLVASPFDFFPDYAPVVEDDVVELLEVTDASQVMVLLMLTAGASLERTTANLLAPILVNTRTRRAVQVILDSATYSVATPLVP